MNAGWGMGLTEQESGDRLVVNTVLRSAIGSNTGNVFTSSELLASETTAASWSGEVLPSPYLTACFCVVSLIISDLTCL
jgi:hypothetical protein